MKYELKKNCIYCFKAIGKRTKGHIISKSIGGTLIYPLACKDCNHKLGGDVEANLSKDYWVNFAKKKLGLSDFKIDSALKFDGRQNKYAVEVQPSGKERYVPPITDKMTWRILAKISYESAAFFIGNRVFLPTFDEYRKFIITGVPDLSEKSIVRACSGFPWEPVHIIEFSPNKELFAIIVHLFNAYIFTSVFWQPVGGPNIFPARVIIDLDNKKTLFLKPSDDGNTWKIIAGY